MIDNVNDDNDVITMKIASKGNDIDDHDYEG